MTIDKPYCFTNPEWYVNTEHGAVLSPKGESIPEVRESYQEFINAVNGVEEMEIIDETQ